MTALPEVPTGWDADYLIARIWYCGDDECRCIQPLIEHVSPGVRRPWRKRETVWEGTFVSTGYGDWPEGVSDATLVEELREAVKAYPDAIWWVSA